MSRERMIQLIAAGSAALGLALAAGVSAAAVFPSRQLLSAAVTIIDQQAQLVDDNGNPITDPSTGLPETEDDTSVNLDVLFLGNILAAGGTTAPSGPTAAISAPPDALLNITVAPAGFCQQLLSPTSQGLVFAPRGFNIPVSELVKAPGLLPAYTFEGLLGGIRFIDPEAKRPVLAPPGATFESEGPDFFDGDPWANLVITTNLLGGELKLDGITDLSTLLGAPRPKVDVVIGVRSLDLQFAATPAVTKPVAQPPVCITVPANVVIRPIGTVEQDN